MTYSNYSVLSVNVSKYTLQPNQKYFVEDICRPYIQSLSKAYFTIAVFNVCYSIIFFPLHKHKDKILFNFNIVNSYYDFSVNDIVMFLDTIFFMLNFFGFGYWILINKVNVLKDLWITKLFT